MSRDSLLFVEGMLSKEELGRYGTGTLTSVFIERVFQECLTYDGEMVSESVKGLLKARTVTGKQTPNSLIVIPCLY